MIESQRKLLREYPHQYLSPGIYLAPEDLTDEALWGKLDRFHINGCRVFFPLADYSFLERLPGLWDLNIYKGSAPRDLRFLWNMEGWFQLHVEEAVLDDLYDLFPDGSHPGLNSHCVCLSGCTVKDLSALSQPGIWLSELVILMPEGSNDKERWKAVRYGKHTCHEYQV